MTMLRYADELKDPAPFFEDIPTEKPGKEMVDIAVELIERKSGAFTPEQFENHYATALRELVDKKTKGQKIIAPHEKRRRAVRWSILWPRSRRASATPHSNPR